MPDIALGIGSNLNREVNIRSTMGCLYDILDKVRVSPIYESTSVGFVGENFFNFVVTAETDLSLADISELLKRIEYDHGRPKNASKFSSRHIDIDILTYDDYVGDYSGIKLPRQEILQQAFVLKPLSELIPEAIHPVEVKSYRQLWLKFLGVKTNLWRSNFQLVKEECVG